MKITPTAILQKAIFLSVLFSLTLLFSCKKDGKLTPDFDNGNLAISYVDTFAITTSVEREDSLRTDGLTLNMIGLYNDPIFGYVSSSLYTQVLLTGVDLDFGTTTPTVDSIVLTLAYAAQYGDSLSELTLDVYELDTELDANTDYYSNTTSSYIPSPVGSSTFWPNLIDNVDIDFDTITRAPHARIKLDNTFGDKILTASSDQLTDDASFSAFMKGFYITPSTTVNNSALNSGLGKIAYFDMNSELSTLTMYYDDTSSYSFSISSTTEKYSYFAQNYASTDVEKQLNNDMSKNTARTYVSSMAGVKTKIELPTIRNLGNGDPVVINKAALIFTVALDKESTVDLVDQTIYLVGIDADGNQIFLADNNSTIESDNTHFDGSYDSSTGTYTFNITRHIHQLLTTTATDYGMYLVSTGAKTEANRVILGSGEEDDTYKIRLEITYSKI
jgi:hypothetical protein